MYKRRAQAQTAGQKVGLGYFVNEVDAAVAYDNYARKHHGEFARTNFELLEYVI